MKKIRQRRLVVGKFGEKKKRERLPFCLEKERLVERRLRKKKVNRGREKKKRVWFVVSFFYNLFYLYFEL